MGAYARLCASVSVYERSLQAVGVFVPVGGALAMLLAMLRVRCYTSFASTMYIRVLCSVCMFSLRRSVCAVLFAVCAVLG